MFDVQDLPMCETMRHVVQVVGGASNFVRFLASDEVVGLAFEGARGMDESSPYWDEIMPAPPPMSRSDFVAAAEQWATEGRAECTSSGWSGTIVQQTMLRSVGPGSDLATDLTITFNVSGGDATATVHMVGHTIQDGATVRGCQTYNHEAFTADGSAPAQVEIVLSPPLSMDDTTGIPPDFPPLPPGVPDPRQGGYFINFIVPQTVRGTHHIESQSVTLPPASACQKTVQDPPYAYAPRGGTIIKPLTDSRPDHLVGADTQTIDGSTVTTTWDLILN
jgi:hypothetical protein